MIIIDTFVYSIGIGILFLLFFYGVYLVTFFIGKLGTRYTQGNQIKIIEKVILTKDVLLCVVEFNSVFYFLSVGKDVKVIEKTKDLSIETSNNSKKFNNILLEQIKDKLNRK